MVNNNKNSTTSKSSKRGRGRPPKSNIYKDSLDKVKSTYEVQVEPGLVAILKSYGLYEFFCESLVALAFKGFTLEECYKLLKMKFKYIFDEDIYYKKFLSAVLQDKNLRDSYFSYSSESLQGFLIKQLKNDSKSNSNIAIELLKISYNQNLPQVVDGSENTEFSKQTTSTLEKILEGLQALE